MQTQNVVLQRVQQAGVVQVGVLGVQADLLTTFTGGQAKQAVEEVAALLSEARQQRVADIQIPVIRARLLISRCALRLPCQLADIAYLAPGLAAGIEGENHHFGVPRQTFQHAHMVRRQTADAEHQ